MLPLAKRKTDLEKAERSSQATKASGNQLEMQIRQKH